MSNVDIVIKVFGGNFKDRVLFLWLFIKILIKIKNNNNYQNTFFQNINFCAPKELGQHIQFGWSNTSNNTFDKAVWA